MGVEDDRALVRRYLSGRDEPAFVALYRAHTPALYRMAWRIGGLDAGTIDEVIQDVWVRVTQRLHTFRFESALRTWLIGILLNAVRDQRRRHLRLVEPLRPLEVDPETSPQPVDVAIDLERAIARLPEGMRSVFVLHDIEGLTHEQVAGCLGVSAGTSKSQLFAARQRLRRWLQGGVEEAL